MGFQDGSIASLTYTALGSGDHPKEMMEVYVDGQILSMKDYKETIVFGSQEKGTSTKTTDKGHEEELRLFAKAIRGESSWPNPFWQQLQATEIAFAVERSGGEL
jgi:predicted dehydrogenase